MSEDKKSTWEKIWETTQNALIAFSIILGIRKPVGPENLKTGEKQTPNWILSAFPRLTDEDEVEYNLTLSAHENPDARVAVEEFEENIKKEGRFDEIKYRVRLIKIRREFLEQIRHPAPKDESGGRLKFTSITLSDPIIEFMGRILAEKNANGKPEEIFERQKKIATNRKLLEEKNFLRKLADNKLATLLWLAVGIFVLFLLLNSILS